MIRRGLATAVVAAALFSLVALAPASRAAGGTSRAQADYALDMFGDAWDFSNPEDFDVTPNVQSEGVRDVALANGQVTGNADAGGKFEFVRSHAGMGLPWGRDPVLYPLDAGHYTTMSFSMAVDHDAAGGVLWYSCAQIVPSCQGGFSFPARAGWHVYTFDIPREPLFASSVPWSGNILGLFIVPSGGASVSAAFDWVRVTPRGADAQPAAPSPPQPRFVSPTRTGGLDYAATVRGDAWDFSESTDVAGSKDLDYSVANGVLDGTNTSHDSYIDLPLAAPIDGTRFHRLSFAIGYEGPFSLEDAPGGGMNARIIWQVAGRPDIYQDSQDIIVYPGWHLYDIDLATDPPSDAVDETDSERIGWAGQSITYLRFDPHEDPGPRHFTLDFIRISEDNSSITPIQFADAAWKSGETVDLFADNDRNGCDGLPIASGIDVAQGVNAVAWPSGSQAGRYWVCGRFHDATFESPVYASGPVDVRATARDVTNACPPARVPPTTYIDVSPDNVHKPNIDCVSWWDIAKGTTIVTYSPSGVVNRGQMATFLARMIDQSGGSLPAGSDRFADDNGNAHEDNINRLAAAGIVDGRSDGTYRPNDPVSRAQMATFLVRAYQYRSGRTLPDNGDAFPDDNGSTHEPNINRAAGSGFVSGRSDGTYGPSLGVTRDQMATFIARVLSKLVHDDGAALPS